MTLPSPAVFPSRRFRGRQIVNEAVSPEIGEEVNEYHTPSFQNAIVNMNPSDATSRCLKTQ